MKSFLTLFVLLFAVALALCTAGCNAISKSADGSLTVNQSVLAADVALVRTVIAAQPAGPKRDQSLTAYDSAATVAEIAAVLASVPPEVKAAAPPDAQAAAARIVQAAAVSAPPPK